MNSVFIAIVFVIFATTSVDASLCSNHNGCDTQTCDKKWFSTCSTCLGETACCNNKADKDFGLCANSGNECPNGGKFVCNGGNCPSGIQCQYVNPKCTKECWGVTTCKDGVCPDDYVEGMFCKQDGNSKNFKVCCGKAADKAECDVSSWSHWSDCSVDGVQQRNRTVIKEATDGSECPHLVEFKACPVNCKLSLWSGWSDCVNNEQTRMRIVQIPARNGGKDCTEALSESQSCKMDIKVDCDVTSWSDWTDCSIDGVQQRKRSVIKEASNGGDCPSLIEFKSCPVDCEMSPWSGWSACTNNAQTRMRVIQIPARNGGAECTESLTETQSCIGCGPILTEFECTLDLTSATNTTVCTLPGGVLTVEIPNRRGAKKAIVRVNSKAVGYVK